MNLNYVPHPMTDLGTPAWKNFQVVRSWAQGIGSVQVDIDVTLGVGEVTVTADWIKPNSVITVSPVGDATVAAYGITMSVGVPTTGSVTVYLNASSAFSDTIPVNVIGVI